MDTTILVWVTVTRRRNKGFVAEYNGRSYAFDAWGDVYMASEGNNWLAFLWQPAQNGELDTGGEVRVRSVRLTPYQRETAFQIVTARELEDFLLGLYDLDPWRQA